MEKENIQREQNEALRNDPLSPELMEVMGRLPIRLGQNGGVFLNNESFDFSKYCIHKLNSSEENYSINIIDKQNKPENFEELLEGGFIREFDLNYEYTKPELYLKNPNQFSLEFEIINRIVGKIEWPIFAKNISYLKNKLSPELQKEMLLLDLLSGRIYTYYNVTFSEDSTVKKDDEGYPFTDADFSDPLAKRLLRYHVFCDSSAHPTGNLENKRDLQSLRDFFEKLSDMERVELLNLTFRKMIESGHERSYFILNKSRHDVAGILCDDKFNYLVDKIDRNSLEILWARDACDSIYRRFSKPGEMEQRRQDAREVTEKLKIDPKTVLDKIPYLFETKSIIANILQVYPELADTDRLKKILNYSIAEDS